MLGNIALGRTDLSNDILDADFPVAEGAKDLETQRMRYRFQRMGGPLNILIMAQQKTQWRVAPMISMIPLQARALVMCH